MTFDQAYEAAQKEAAKKVVVWAFENRDDGEYALHYATLDLLEKQGWNIEKEDW